MLAPRIVEHPKYRTGSVEVGSTILVVAPMVISRILVIEACDPLPGFEITLAGGDGGSTQFCRRLLLFLGVVT